MGYGCGNVHVALLMRQLNQNSIVNLFVIFRSGFSRGWFFFYSVCMKCTLFSLHQSSIYSIVYHYNAYAEKKESQRDCIHFRKMTVDFHKTRLIRTNWPFLFGLFNAIKVRLNFIVHLHFPMLFAFIFLCSLLKLSILICFKQFYHHANRMN